MDHETLNQGARSMVAPWVDISERQPSTEGRYLCYVEIPNRGYRRSQAFKPAHNRYLVLSFDDGGFWINTGLPNGLVKYWMPIPPLPAAGSQDGAAESSCAIVKVQG